MKRHRLRLLGIDTSTQNAGVAVLLDAEDGTHRIFERQRRVTTHSEMLLTLVDEVLTEAQLAPKEIDAVVCGRGPGSFTGLRIGLSTAKGLCFALGRPLFLVSSLAALAARAPRGARVCAALDAYRGEVYAAIFRVRPDGFLELEGAEEAIAPARLGERLEERRHAGPIFLVGEGILRYPELLREGEVCDSDGAPRPGDLVRLGAIEVREGRVADLAKSTPEYLRASEAELAKQRKS
jgi:tRNA threonylcarbamoyladenosine biosynthesis protein TsaB